MSRNRKTKHAVSHELPAKTSKLSVEIFRLLREGDANSRNKAQKLLQSAIEKRHAEKHCAPVKGDVS